MFRDISTHFLQCMTFFQNEDWKILPFSVFFLLNPASTNDIRKKFFKSQKLKFPISKKLNFFVNVWKSKVGRLLLFVGNFRQCQITYTNLSRNLRVMFIRIRWFVANRRIPPQALKVVRSRFHIRRFDFWNRTQLYFGWTGSWKQLLVNDRHRQIIW